MFFGSRWFTLKTKVLYSIPKMKNPEHPLHTLTEIRSLMERSSRFISLSGLSGVSAGICALVGAAFAYVYLDIDLFSDHYPTYLRDAAGRLHPEVLTFLMVDALLVLFFSISFGVYFTTRKARRQGQKIWDATAARLLTNLLLPLATGGIFALILLYHGLIGLLAPTTLIFYGLALLNASKYTLNDIRYLGICEIILGLVSALWIGYGLLFWAIGFGLLHILYGSMMYFKYERSASA